MNTPATRPQRAHFSSGPCAKRPGYSLQNLDTATLGRSHRAKIGKARLKQAIDLTREVLGVPADYKIGIVPASDTGAVEMAMWSLLGARGVDMVTWESFGDGTEFRPIDNQEVLARLEPGERLCVYTDGVLSDAGSVGDLANFPAQLEAELRSGLALPIELAADRLVTTIRQESVGQTPDDWCCVLFEIDGAADR